MSTKSENNQGCAGPLAALAIMLAFLIFAIPKIHNSLLNVTREHEAFELGLGEYFVNKDGFKEFRWKPVRP